MALAASVCWPRLPTMARVNRGCMCCLLSTVVGFLSAMQKQRRVTSPGQRAHRPPVVGSAGTVLGKASQGTAGKHGHGLVLYATEDQ